MLQFKGKNWILGFYRLYQKVLYHSVTIQTAIGKIFSIYSTNRKSKFDNIFLFFLWFKNNNFFSRETAKL